MDASAHKPQHAPLNGAGPGSGNLRSELTRRELQRAGQPFYLRPLSEREYLAAFGPPIPA